MSEAQAAVRFDGSTLWAAVVTLAFAVATGMALSFVPQSGNLGGVIDALKNVAYVLTVPIFDLTRRVFSAREAARANAVGPPDRPDIFRLAFVSALVLFVIVELLSVLTGFGIGSLCVTLANGPAAGLEFGPCLVTGLNVVGPAVIAPIMLALGIAAGWIWRGALKSGFFVALLIFALVVAVLFALDFYVVLTNRNLGPVQALQDHAHHIGALRQVGPQVVLLSVGVMLGYGARRLWQAIARAFG